MKFVVFFFFYQKIYVMLILFDILMIYFNIDFDFIYISLKNNVFVKGFFY